MRSNKLPESGTFRQLLLAGLFGLVPTSSIPDGMTFIMQRKDRFYVVAYDGLDPLTGKERRRWHPVGTDRYDAELVAARIDRDDAGAAPSRGEPVHLGQFLTGTWLALKRRHVRATTAYRYSWYVDRYINPAIGDVPLRRLRADPLDGLYEQLATTAGRHGTGLAPKTMHEVHVIVRASLDLAVRRAAPRPQRRARAPRALASDVHDAHLPALAPRHERRGGRAVRVADRRSEPVDVYRRRRLEIPGERAA